MLSSFCLDQVTDVGAAVVLCSLFHQTYAEFAPLLLENWQKILSLKKDEKVSSLLLFFFIALCLYLS